MSKKVVILQSNYIPWKGYFDLIAASDLFIFHDDLQYTTGDWRNRNKIKTENGTDWLSIPVGSNENRLIEEVEWEDSSWMDQHKRVIKNYYSDCPFFTEELLDSIYDKSVRNLSKFNQTTIKLITSELGLNKEFRNSSDLGGTGSKTEKVISLLKKVEATSYISGPSGAEYLNESQFADAGITLEYFSYEGYKPYFQKFGDFVHEVSILDLIFNTGPEAAKYLLYKAF